MNNRRLLLTAIALVLLFMQANRLFAQGVLFSEYRVILKNQLITSLHVCNPTEEVLSFSLSFINKTMDENGAMHEVADTVALPTSLKNYLRIYPRSIRLDPGQCQEVQIQRKAKSESILTDIDTLKMHNMRINAVGYNISPTFTVDRSTNLLLRGNVNGELLKGSFLVNYNYSSMNYQPWNNNLTFNWNKPLLDRKWLKTLNVYHDYQNLVTTTHGYVTAVTISNEKHNSYLNTNYTYQGKTTPDTEVEIYNNGTLVQYVRSDSLGHCQVEVPTVKCDATLSTNIGRRVNGSFTYERYRVGQTVVDYAPQERLSLNFNGDLPFRKLRGNYYLNALYYKYPFTESFSAYFGVYFWLRKFLINASVSSGSDCMKIDMLNMELRNTE